MGRRFLIGMVMLTATTASAGGFVPYKAIFLDRCDGCVIGAGVPDSRTDRDGSGSCTISYGANWVTILIAIRIAIGARRRRR